MDYRYLFWTLVVLKRTFLFVSVNHPHITVGCAARLKTISCPRDHVSLVGFVKGFRTIRHKNFDNRPGEIFSDFRQLMTVTCTHAGEVSSIPTGQNTKQEPIDFIQFLYENRKEKLNFKMFYQTNYFIVQLNTSIKSCFSKVYYWIYFTELTSTRDHTSLTSLNHNGSKKSFKTENNILAVISIIFYCVGCDFEIYHWCHVYMCFEIWKIYIFISWCIGNW